MRTIALSISLTLFILFVQWARDTRRARQNHRRMEALLTSSPKPIPGIRFEDAYQERVQRVADVITPLFPGEPWIQQGKFNWFKLEGDSSPREITLFFLDLALIIQVHGPGIAPFASDSGVVVYQGPERAAAAARFLRDTCKREQVGMLEIFWGAEIDPVAIKSKLDAMGVEFPESP